MPWQLCWKHCVAFHLRIFPLRASHFVPLIPPGNLFALLSPSSVAEGSGNLFRESTIPLVVEAVRPAECGVKCGPWRLGLVRHKRRRQRKTFYRAVPQYPITSHYILLDFYSYTATWHIATKNSMRVLASSVISEQGIIHTGGITKARRGTNLGAESFRRYRGNRDFSSHHVRFPAKASFIVSADNS